MSQYQQLLLLALDADLNSPAAQRAKALAKTTGQGCMSWVYLNLMGLATGEKK
nr:hypothetical protein [Pseudomonas sp. BIGb0427]